MANIKIKITLLLLMIVLLSVPTFAASLKDNRYYYNKTDYYKSTWQWLDLNNDKVYECYYFNVLGHMYKDGITPDGYKVDINGCLIVNGIPVRKTEEEVLLMYENRDKGISTDTLLPSILKDNNHTLKNYTVSEITLEYTNELNDYISDSIYEANLYVVQKIIDKTLLIDLEGFYIKNLNKIKNEYYNKLLELDKDNCITHNDFVTLKKMLSDIFIEKKKLLKTHINNINMNITWKFDREEVKEKRKEIFTIY